MYIILYSKFIVDKFKKQKWRQRTHTNDLITQVYTGIKYSPKLIVVSSMTKKQRQISIPYFFHLIFIIITNNHLPVRLLIFQSNRTHTLEITNDNLGKFTQNRRISWVCIHTISLTLKEMYYIVTIFHL